MTFAQRMMVLRTLIGLHGDVTLGHGRDKGWW